MVSTFERFAASMTGFLVVVLSTSKQIPEWFVTKFDKLLAHFQLSYTALFLSSRISQSVIEKIKIESLTQIHRVNYNYYCCCYYYYY
jgi:hypothetical protein